jgi:hypothetical protein
MGEVKVKCPKCGKAAELMSFNVQITADEEGKSLFGPGPVQVFLSENEVTLVGPAPVFAARGSSEVAGCLSSWLLRGSLVSFIAGFALGSAWFVVGAISLVVGLVLYGLQDVGYKRIRLPRADLSISRSDTDPTEFSLTCNKTLYRLFKVEAQLSYSRCHAIIPGEPLPHVIELSTETSSDVFWQMWSTPSVDLLPHYIPGSGSAVPESGAFYVPSEEMELSWRLGHEILHAAAKGDLTEVAELIAHGADVNGRDQWGESLLHKATEEGHKDIAELLIEKGADVNAKSTHEWSVVLTFRTKTVPAGTTPLGIARVHGYRDVAGLLRKHGGTG